MNIDTDARARAGARRAAPAIDARPAWLDLVEGASALFLVLFMWAHMALVSSILLGNDAMYRVARMFEGEPLLGERHPALVSAVVAVVLVVFVVHAVTAIRRAPSSYRQYHAWRRHVAVFRHADTSLWMVQVVTGLVLMFFAGAHLYQMFSHPAEIGPYASSDRVWSGRWWPLYLVLLFAVELHGGIGLYRLVVKWGGFADIQGRSHRVVLKRAKWVLTGFFLVLGLATLAAYMKLGHAHRDAVGERYVPGVEASVPRAATPARDG